MIGVEFITEYSKTRSFAAAAGGEVKRGILKGLRKTIAALEAHHKEKEFQSGKDTPVHATKLTHRTRALSRSYIGKIDKSKLQGRYGSNFDYARIHELGGLTGRGHKTKIPKRPTLQRTMKAVLKKRGRLIVGDEVEKRLDRAK